MTSDPTIKKPNVNKKGDHPFLATVLIVEDDLTILGLMDTLLSYQGFKVLCASSIKSADLLVKNYTDKIDFLICDLNLTDGSGIYLANRLVSEYGMMTIFISGDANSAHFIKQLNFELLGYFDKPFRIKDIGLLMELNIVKVKTGV